MKPDYYNAPCPICGEAKYEWGEVRTLVYTSNDSSFVERLIPSGHTLPARHCETCGNIQLFSRWMTSEEEYLAALQDEDIEDVTTETDEN